MQELSSADPKCCHHQRDRQERQQAWGDLGLRLGAGDAARLGQIEARRQEIKPIAHFDIGIIRRVVDAAGLAAIHRSGGDARQIFGVDMVGDAVFARDQGGRAVFQAR